VAAAIAGAFAAEVVVVHVIPSGPRVAQKVVLPSEASLWKFCQDDFKGLAVTAQMHTGSIWDRIVHTATVEEADLIIMATRGHDSVADRVMGSNTERVMRHAPCPVLVA
jgi:nucleotide-binding universal stress UspA family protein